jgi:hypothetical protein
MELSRQAQLLAGLVILERYDNSGDIDFQHDEGFFSGPPPEDMSENDRRDLKRYGFRWSGEFESWCKFS